MTIGKFLCAYLTLINLLTFIAFGADKSKAVKQQWRVQEKTLLLLSFLGGLLGGWLGISFFRHKTRDFSFLVFMMVITVSWLIGIMYFYPESLRGLNK